MLRLSIIALVGLLLSGCATIQPSDTQTGSLSTIESGTILTGSEQMQTGIDLSTGALINSGIIIDTGTITGTTSTLAVNSESSNAQSNIQPNLSSTDGSTMFDLSACNKLLDTFVGVKPGSQVTESDKQRILGNIKQKNELCLYREGGYTQTLRDGDFSFTAESPDFNPLLREPSQTYIDTMKTVFTFNGKQIPVWFEQSNKTRYQKALKANGSEAFELIVGAESISSLLDISPRGRYVLYSAGCYECYDENRLVMIDTNNGNKVIDIRYRGGLGDLFAWTRDANQFVYIDQTTQNNREDLNIMITQSNNFPRTSIIAKLSDFGESAQRFDGLLVDENYLYISTAKNGEGDNKEITGLRIYDLKTLKKVY